ncbi:uncharacterized protein LOC101700014 isoform X3 [Heterocephalus glaber]|uniref:Uncharacterized protein LOC101700014 isoform X3 n=1 Tax=Heterocephalus glaber TaxID=10181 RepID=A0AAX6SXH4_HETGA|nr:uncharacterized protein LOC101700014 isoform X3 [Heterocephalus glaber]
MKTRMQGFKRARRRDQRGRRALRLRSRNSPALGRGCCSGSSEGPARITTAGTEWDRDLSLPRAPVLGLSIPTGHETPLPGGRTAPRRSERVLRAKTGKKPKAETGGKVAAWPPATPCSPWQELLRPRDSVVQGLTHSSAPGAVPSPKN